MQTSAMLTVSSRSAPNWFATQRPVSGACCVPFVARLGRTAADGGIHSRGALTLEFAQLDEVADVASAIVVALDRDCAVLDLEVESTQIVVVARVIQVRGDPAA